MLKDLFKGSAIYGITPFIPRILTVLLLPILTKYLTSTDYGIIGSITSITFAVQALHDLGLRALLPNYFYKSRGHYKVMWREIYGFLSLWMILYALIQATLLYFFIPEEGGPMYIDSMCILKNSRHYELAMEFINFIHRPEIYAQFLDQFGFPAGVNPAAAQYMQKKAHYSVEQLANCEIKEDLAENLAKYSTLWEQIRFEE